MRGVGQLPRNSLALFLGALFLLAAALPADHFWTSKPSTQWSVGEAVKLLKDSPWSRLVIRSIAQPEKRPDMGFDNSVAHCDPDAVDANGNCLQRRVTLGEDPSRSPRVLFSTAPSRIFLVRWESAVPVMEAFQRLQALGERAAREFLSAPPRLPADRYLITVKLLDPGAQARDPRAAAEPTDFLGPLHDAKGNSRATLKVGSTTVAPAEAERSGVGASQAVHFYFPRLVSGVPLIPSGRQAQAVFEFRGETVSLKTHFSLDPQILE